MEINRVYKGKAENELKLWPSNFFDSCVTDEPWAYRFMNKHWDYELPSVELWKEVLRVLKPGAFMFVCCGARTQHRSTVNIEDAGFIIRDIVTHHFGSGFPKSMNMGSGNGTALKPATEFWTLAQKPISEKTIALNFVKWGTGTIRIDDCRIAFVSDADRESATYGTGIDIKDGALKEGYKQTEEKNIEANPKGRFPANVILSHSPDCKYRGLTKVKGTFTGNGDAEIGEQSKGVPFRRGEGIDRTDEDGLETIESWECVSYCPVRIMNEQAPAAGAFAPVPSGVRKRGNVYNEYKQQGLNEDVFYGDSGGAARFFYVPKPDTFEKEKGLKDFELNEPVYGKNMSSSDKGTMSNSVNKRRNDHPTVKPISLCRYLVRMITPKGGIVLDPFCGSGTTLIGAKLELMNWVGIDMVQKHCDISTARVAAWNPPKYKEQTLF